MSFGHPDWGVSAPRDTIASLQDMAELAARLGSINTFDRRGDTIWMDNFEDNLNKWWILAAGTGASAALSFDTARNGARSARLVTGNVAGNSTLIVKHLPLPVEGPIGIEVSFTLSSDHRSFVLEIIYAKGTTQHAASVIYLPPTNTLLLGTTAGGTVTIDPNLRLFRDPRSFNTLKLVLNTLTNHHARLIINNNHYDISRHPIWTLTDPTVPNIRITIMATTNVAAHITSYIDDVIITQNEPR